MPSTTHQTVTVNLNVSVDASGNIDVFGQTAPNITNKIVATTKLPVRALYDAYGASNNGTLNSLFEFWEPSDALGTRRATLAISEGRDYIKMTKKLVMDLQSVIMGEFDCSDAKPFKTNYTVEEYYKHPHFGRVALSSYAHYLFGHVAATAAITNDSAFMGAMMSTTDVTATSPGTYTFASTADVSFNDVTPSTLDAKLALRLVNEITTKDDTAILAIVEQVLGQDASRAMDEDNNALAPGGTHPLLFMAGDKIYMNITLKRPSITILNGGINAGAPDATQKFLENADTNYTLEITLDDIPGYEFEFENNDLGYETLWRKVGNDSINTDFPNGTVKAVIKQGNNIFIGGEFTSVGDVPNTTYIAKWDGSSWSALGTGIQVNFTGTQPLLPGVLSLALSPDGNSLYVGGEFTSAGNVENTIRVAKYNILTDTWEALGSGIGSTSAGTFVRTLVVSSNGTLYAGGNFLNRVQKFNGISWSAIKSENIGTVLTIALSADETTLYAGGFLNNYNNLASISLISAIPEWTTVGGGTNSAVRNIIVNNNILYIGGLFNSVGSNLAANYIASYNLTTNTWSTLGSGLNNEVYNMKLDGTDLYVGGAFTEAGGQPANYVAKWNTVTQQWSPLQNGTSNYVLGLEIGQENTTKYLYVGGRFLSVDYIINDGLDYNYIAKYIISQ